ncbi:DNA polymerase III subunit delta [Serpentinicella sp. ANB-PHB4]|uniref:DNA polymerase III subunit delta n=1 Tax=Serpentinicella sp. ANB-PHB4 TaxID=3074076 RepID=UPI002864DFC8|nr:DNA polymerase III subunit delta [Serpentinicella sp. ANB-PHB4]MDR5657961.1 DNA polymerase III subunit delta [Serpentinicella sp. ANB-PHB4]
MSYKEIVEDIKKNTFEKVYLFYGEEVYLVKHFANELRKKVVKNEFEELNYIEMDEKEFSIDDFVNASETLPFMSNKKLILIKYPELFSSKKKQLTDEEEEQIISQINNIPDTTCLVFIAQNVDTRRKLTKTIKKNGKIIDFQKLQISELKRWIEKKLKIKEKIISKDNIQYLIENLTYVQKNSEQTLYDVDNELNKLIAYVGERKEINRDDIDKLYVSLLQNNIFMLLDHIERKDIHKAILALNNIIVNGEPIIKILVMMSNHIRNLLKSKLLLEQGYSSKMISSELKLHPFVASKCVNQSKLFKIKELKNLVALSLDFDFKIKQGQIDSELALELLIIEMCK